MAVRSNVLLMTMMCRDSARRRRTW